MVSIRTFELDIVKRSLNVCLAENNSSVHSLNRLYLKIVQWLAYQILACGTRKFK